MQNNMIGENDAAALAGVSVRTLLRFAEAGYLQVENDVDGLRRYALGEVKDLFGIMDNQFYERLADDISEATQAVSAVSTPHKAEEAPAVAEEQVKDINSAIEVSTYQDTPASEKISFQDETASRLRQVIALQEKLLDAKDDQIKELREERDWLKTRYEKQEQKSERDQLLLLSESQMVRKLWALHSERRSPVRAALEWFGLVAPRNNSLQLGMTVAQEQEPKS